MLHEICNDALVHWLDQRRRHPYRQTNNDSLDTGDEVMLQGTHRLAPWARDKHAAAACLSPAQVLQRPAELINAVVVTHAGHTVTQATFHASRGVMWASADDVLSLTRITAVAYKRSAGVLGTESIRAYNRILRL